MNKNVYLAGPIGGLSYTDATDWRALATGYLMGRGLFARSPMRGKEALMGVTNLDSVEYTHPLATPKGLTTRDRHDTMTAGAVLMNLTGAQKVSIGTMIEVGWADAARVPIVLVMEPGNVHAGHPMLTTMAGYIVPTLEEGLDIVVSLLA